MSDISVARPRETTSWSRRRAVFGPDKATRSGRLALHLGRTHVVAGVLEAIALSYVVIAASLIATGLLMTHVLAHGSIGHWDTHVNQWFVAHRTTGLNALSLRFTQLANTMGIVAVAVVVTLVLFVRHWGRRALLLLIGLGLELSIFLTSNYLVRRPRPGVAHLGSTPSTFSWPSGHIAATFVLYGGIAVLVMAATRKRWPAIAAWFVAVALTVGVGLSRVYRGEHHPLDVFAGLALGVAALSGAVFVLRTWEAHAADDSDDVTATVAA